MLRTPLWMVAILVVLLGSSVAAQASTIFEAPHVHPLDMTPDGTRLIAVNTDDQRVSVFDLTSGSPVLMAEIPVGYEPVTVRARTNTEVWVVNHVSDSISILDLTTLNVVKTLLVGDEPTDVVFAGAPSRAFVSVSQEDRVRVYDAAAPGASLADIPLASMDPRSLAVGLGGTKVFVGAMDSGNNTTIVDRDTVFVDSLGMPPPVPAMAGGLPAPPRNALIVRHNGTNFVDELNRSWDHRLPFTLGDHDITEIDVATLTITNTYKGVGTTLFNLAVNPSSGRLYVSNQEATNELRFEPNLNGQFARAQVTTIDTGSSTVTQVHLNNHINYGVPNGSPGERALSLGLPVDITVSSNGLNVYVAAFGSKKIGVLDANAAIVKRIDVGGGPTGVVLDEPRTSLYVLNRFDNTISQVDLGTDVATDVPLGFDATPLNIRSGRARFYDTENSSAHGDLACTSCHIWGGTDHLAWDLGDPTGSLAPVPPGHPASGNFHPMKGPMFTQALKGLTGTAPFHWRGDRPDLLSFNAAFTTIMGRATMLPFGEFQEIEDFVFAVQYPPNPNRNLDGTLPGGTPSAANGETLFNSGGLAGGGNCVDCHNAPTGTNQIIIPKGAVTEPIALKTPQLRNLYEKAGFDTTMSEVKTGFGFGNDAAKRTLFEQLEHVAFSFGNPNDRKDVVAFLNGYDTGTPAAVGAQWTMDGTNEPAGIARVNTLVALADANTVGLIAKGRDLAGDLRGWTYQGSGNWISDREAEGIMSLANVLSIAGAGSEITFTAVPEGCETRLGVDRDQDTYRDIDEVEYGTDPADPNSNPAVTGVGDLAGGPRTIALARAFPNPAGSSGTQISFQLASAGAARVDVFDVQGRQIKTLFNDANAAPGQHDVHWDLRDGRGQGVVPGIYFYRLTTPEGSVGQRLVVLR